MASDPIGSHGPVVFVEGGSEAHGYVVSAFCRSYEPVALRLAGLNHASALPAAFRKLLCEGLHAQVKAALARSRVLVAVAERDPDSILGCVLYEARSDGPVIHYVYVDHPARRTGLGTAMLTALARTCPHASKGARYTHHTTAGATLARAFHLSFTPEEA